MKLKKTTLIVMCLALSGKLVNAGNIINPRTISNYEILGQFTKINYRALHEIRINKCEFEKVNSGDYCLKVNKTTYRDECDYLKLSEGSLIECQSEVEFRDRIKAPFFKISVKNGEEQKNTFFYLSIDNPFKKNENIETHYDFSSNLEMRNIREEYMDSSFHKVNLLQYKIIETLDISKSDYFRCFRVMKQEQGFLDKIMRFFTAFTCRDIKEKLDRNKGGVKKLFVLLESEFSRVNKIGVKAQEKSQNQLREKYQSICEHLNLKRHLISIQNADKRKCVDRFGKKAIKESLEIFRFVPGEVDDKRQYTAIDRYHKIMKQITGECEFRRYKPDMLLSFPLDCKLPVFVKDATDLKL